MLLYLGWTPSSYHDIAWLSRGIRTKGGGRRSAAEEPHESFHSSVVCCSCFPVCCRCFSATKRRLVSSISRFLVCSHLQANNRVVSTNVFSMDFYFGEKLLKRPQRCMKKLGLGHLGRRSYHGGGTQTTCGQSGEGPYITDIQS